MSVKIKVSYTEDNEKVSQVLALLKPLIQTQKESKRQQGPYKKLYLTLKE